ncbi:hypothetical protein [Ferrovibrio sp.]|uniref:hypothetical protein n=1 Tax=Ferrovibrio sp. TaxID=1917215 RepID=UPI003D2D4F8D
MKKKQDFAEADGATIAICLVVVFLLTALAAAATNDIFFNLAKDLDGLLGSIGAIAAALIAYRGLAQQIRQSSEFEQAKSREREINVVIKARQMVVTIVAQLSHTAGHDAFTDFDKESEIEYVASVADFSYPDQLDDIWNNLGLFNGQMIFEVTRLTDEIKQFIIARDAMTIVGESRSGKDPNKWTVIYDNSDKYPRKVAQLGNEIIERCYVLQSLIDEHWPIEPMTEDERMWYRYGDPTPDPE